MFWMWLLCPEFSIYDKKQVTFAVVFEGQRLKVKSMLQLSKDVKCVGVFCRCQEVESLNVTMKNKGKL